MKSLSTFAVAAVFALGGSLPAGAQSLVKFASLPADTFAPGPTSGQLIAQANGRVPPFVDKQPVQGFSSVLKTPGGDFLAMSDNGFGAKPNSPDYVLRFHRIDPDFRTATGGSGTIVVESFTTLSDPFNRSPQNPFLGGETPNLLASKGFEGMSIAPNGKTLYPMLEGALTTDPDQRRLRIHEFDVDGRAYTGKQWFCRLESAANAIGDLTTVTKNLMLVIERDNLQGAAAQFKRIFLVNLDEVGADGFLVKHQVADLMQLRDTLNLGGHGATFTFPFQTIESVIPLSERELGILDDNNYPFSSARVPGQPDPNEFIVIRLDRPLQNSAR